MKRIAIAVLCLIEFIFICAFMLYCTVLLIPGVVLGAPVWAVLWTIFAFDVLWLITLKYNLKHRIIFSFISGFSVYNLIANLSLLSSLGNLTSNKTTKFIVYNIIQIILIVYIVMFLKSKVKKLKKRASISR